MKASFPFLIALATFALAPLSACSSHHYSPGNSTAAVQHAVAKAKRIAPGLKINDIERENEFGEISWTVEGDVRGQKVEIEFEAEGDERVADSGKAIRTK